MYDFVWLDEAIELLDRYGIKTILGTPTAAMPKWQYDKYPDVIGGVLKGIEAGLSV